MDERHIHIYVCCRIILVGLISEGASHSGEILAWLSCNFYI